MNRRMDRMYQAHCVYRTDVLLKSHCLHVNMTTLHFVFRAAKPILFTANLGIHVSGWICIDGSCPEQQSLMKNICYVHLRTVWHEVHKLGTHSLCGCALMKWCWCYSNWSDRLQLSINKINTLKSRQNGHHFVDDLFKCIYVIENVWISVKFHWSLFLRVQLIIFQHWFR